MYTVYYNLIWAATLQKFYDYEDLWLKGEGEKGKAKEESLLTAIHPMFTLSLPIYPRYLLVYAHFSKYMSI